MIFAIDTTRSMLQEIAESRKIVKDIIEVPRHATVDYILSPYNDPGMFSSSFQWLKNRDFDESYSKDNS